MTAPRGTGVPARVASVLGVDDRPVGPLTVAEAQEAVRMLLGRRSRLVDGGHLACGGPAGGDTGLDRGDTGVGRGDMPGQVSVIAGHPGAGSSTVALALADAAAAAGGAVHLLDPCAPGRSGLVAAADAELGTDATGTWRRGRRTSIIIERRASSGGTPTSTPSDVTVDVLTVLDLGSVETTTGSSAPTVVVCRANVPGVRLVEQRLALLSHRPLVVAVVGPHGWSREVRAAVGPCLTRLRDTGLVVSVPWDSRLDVTGLTDRPLPRPVVAAGAQILSMLRTAEHLRDRDARGAERSGQ